MRSELCMEFAGRKYNCQDIVQFSYYESLYQGRIIGYEQELYCIEVFENGNPCQYFIPQENILKTVMSESTAPYGVSYVADKPKASLESQVGGEHYKNLAIQPVEYCYRNNIPAIESSIIRYATRHRDKNKDQDIKKIIHYAKILLQLEYNYTDEQIAEL